MTYLDSVNAVSYVYDLEIRVGRPGQVGGGLPSVLGQDVLGRWVIVRASYAGRVRGFAFHFSHAYGSQTVTCVSDWHRPSLLSRNTQPLGLGFPVPFHADNAHAPW